MKKVIIILSLLISGCFPMPSAPEPEDSLQMQRLVDEGVMYLREGDLERARSDFQLALELGTSAAAIDGMGCVAFLEEDYKSAEKLFWEAYEADSTYATSLGNLALLYEKQGNMAKATELYARVLKEDPKNFRARNNYAVYLAQNKRAHNQAISELFKAQALFNHPLIYDNINLLNKE